MKVITILMVMFYSVNAACNCNYTPTMIQNMQATVLGPTINQNLIGWSDPTNCGDIDNSKGELDCGTEVW